VVAEKTQEESYQKFPQILQQPNWEPSTKLVAFKHKELTAAHCWRPET
jgi:hypothetical protein